MNRQLLIDAIVQQTTVLIAQVATSGGARTPLSHVAHRVFLDLASELEAQGLSRKVTADMFGISLRSYQRKLNRLHESQSEKGKTLWEALFDYVGGAPVRRRSDVLKRFARDDEASVRGILVDLVDSGLVFTTGSGDDAVYRVVQAQELRAEDEAADDALVWVLIYREGPLRFDELMEKTRTDQSALTPIVERLLAAGHVQRTNDEDSEVLSAKRFELQRDVSLGWEAALYDHYHALVRTLCARLDPDTARDPQREHIGGSTYSLDVDRNHPLRDEVLGTLSRHRRELSDLRRRVNEHNDQRRPTDAPERVVVYTGQCVFPQDPPKAATPSTPTTLDTTQEHS